MRTDSNRIYLPSGEYAFIVTKTKQISPRHLAVYYDGATVPYIHHMDPEHINIEEGYFGVSTRNGLIYLSPSEFEEEYITNQKEYPDG